MHDMCWHSILGQNGSFVRAYLPLRVEHIIMVRYLQDTDFKLEVKNLILVFFKSFF